MNLCHPSLCTNWTRSTWGANLLACLVILLALTGASGQAIAADTEQLLAVDRAFAAMSVEKGSATAFAAYAAPDATMFQMGADPVVGLEAIKRELKNQPPGQLNWVPRRADIAASGDLGYTTGDYTYQPAGSSDIYTGRYVSIWKLQPEGKWKWVVDIGNPAARPKEGSISATNKQ